MSKIIAEQPPSRRLWAFAAVVAIAIHLGCVALAMARMQTDELDDDLGAPAIEIGLDLTSPHREATDFRPDRISTRQSRRPHLPNKRRW